MRTNNGHGGEIVRIINRCPTREAARTTLKYFISLPTNEILTRRSVNFQTFRGRKWICTIFVLANMSQTCEG